MGPNYRIDEVALKVCRDWRWVRAHLADIALFLSVAIAVVWPTMAGAQGIRWQFSTKDTVGNERDFLEDDDLDPTTPLVLQGEDRFETDNWVRYIRPLGNGRVLRLGQQIKYRRFFDRSELSGLYLTPRVEYWDQFDPEWEARLLADYTYFNRDGDAWYNRVRAQAMLRYEPEDRLTMTMGRVLVSYYDYLTDSLPGFDQTRVLVGGEHYWYPGGADNYFRDTSFGLEAYYEHAFADGSNASYDRVWLGATAWWVEALPRLNIGVDGQIEFRDYGAAPGFASASDRKETRYELDLNLEYLLWEQAYWIGTIGYEFGRSKVDQYDYNGLVYETGFKATF